MADDFDSDRFRDLPEREQRLAALRRDGIEPIDRQGRPRVVLGDGPESRLALSTAHVRHARQQPISDHLTLAEWKRMYLAVATANYRGWMLNTFVTVSWELSGVQHPPYIKSLHDRFTDLMRRWCRDVTKALQKSPDTRLSQQEVPFAGIWVREVGERMGLHTHLLVHVPPPLFQRFRRWARRAAHTLTETPRPDPRTGSAGKQLVHIQQLSDVDGQWRVFRYMMKGINRETLPPTMQPDFREFLTVEFPLQKTVPQGRIEGARCGASRSIGPAAREHLRETLGLPGMWPEDFDPAAPHYGRDYLNTGDLRRSLLQIEI
ncbi:hypothetical protein [Novosphingobium resinovorum]|uniref:hypothetical protein n=1 Tax=Novosphingobium resinovorum TaxID=158500 RepID=UPI000562ED3B|nr:hypothetical protein [Novosphingobium resinovorum]